VSILADKDLIGKVIHYYDKIQVAVLKLDKSLKVGDKVKFVHGDREFEQTLESMQLEHKQVESGKKGQEVAVKVDKEAKSGTLIKLVK
jgi:putative protease